MGAGVVEDSAPPRQRWRAAVAEGTVVGGRELGGGRCNLSRVVEGVRCRRIDAWMLRIDFGHKRELELVVLTRFRMMMFSLLLAGLSCDLCWWMVLWRLLWEEGRR